MSTTRDAAKIERLLKKTLAEMWTGQRLLTLARTVAQDRQFENWWKFEVAAALWPVAKQLGCDVWVEAPGRTDVSLMLAPGTPPTGDSPRVLIELKTMGTFWGAGSINKAFEEPGKKRLVEDLRACATNSRGARPFGVVGLLLTHQPWTAASDPRVFDRFWDAALSLPKKYGLANLHRFFDSEIQLPEPGLGYKAGIARQVFWIHRSSHAEK
jgi:hypothetical protein